MIRHGGKILCMQHGRTKFDYTSFKYEFPGGKIEPGETPQQALHRELLEEMDYDVRVGDRLVTVEHTYPDFGITLTAFVCDVESTDFRMNEHIAFKWCTREELRQLDWAAADTGIVKAL